MSDTMHDQRSDTTAPGWYPDPAGRHAQRYWDGVRFTDHVATAQGAMSVDQGAPPRGVPDVHASDRASTTRGVELRTHASGKRYFGFLPAWRPLAYVILVFNVLMLVWMMNISSSAKPGESAAAGAVDILILFLTAIGDVILGVIFLVTRRERVT